ncbi:hypothetical protein [Streptomyces sp. NPDC052042]|uniref:hypothetical protein n=1 Tax=Streptomyces sp. NPDC052042 TaxID=3365683 RepID=UPI0037CDAE58
MQGHRSHLVQQVESGPQLGGWPERALIVMDVDNEDGAQPRPVTLGEQHCGTVHEHATGQEILALPFFVGRREHRRPGDPAGWYLEGRSRFPARAVPACGTLGTPSFLTVH